MGAPEHRAHYAASPPALGHKTQEIAAGVACGSPTAVAGAQTTAARRAPGTTRPPFSLFILTCAQDGGAGGAHGGAHGGAVRGRKGVRRYTVPC